MRYRSIITWAAWALALSPLLVAPTLAQGPDAGEQEEAIRPTPRFPDGRVNLGVPSGDIRGIWGSAGGNLADRDDAEPGGRGQNRFPGRPKVSEVPFKPWARSVYDYRALNQFEPHTRCHPSGGERQFATPYGTEFVDIPELGRIYIFDIGGPHTFRIIYTDGQGHPEELEPSNYGHSIGHWEGDTLVVDTVGFSERFWMDRQGTPHTEELHFVERFTRLDFNTLKYEVTIEDPGAYTETWSTGFYMEWRDAELFEYICQDNNFASQLMIGAEEEVDRTSRIAP